MTARANEALTKAVGASPTRTPTPSPATGDVPELHRTAYHEAGHVVADVGLMGEFCYQVCAFSQPTLVHDRRDRAQTVLGLCETTFANQPATLTVQSLKHCPEMAPMAFARAVNRVICLAAGPFAEAEFLGEGDWFDETDFPIGGEGDLEQAHEALLPFFEDEIERWQALGKIWCRTPNVMRRPNVWAAVESVANALIELDGRGPLSGDVAEQLIKRHLRRRKLRTTPIIKVKWQGRINTLLLDGGAR